MLSVFAVRLALLIIICAAYAIFDVFNKRNVPNVFAFAALIIAAITLILTNNAEGIAYGGVVALLIGAMSYLLYRSGFLGGGDLFEFVTIAMILPTQNLPFFSGLVQFNLPFILSVFIATGYVTVWIIPIYYLIFAKKTEPRKVPIERGALTAGITLLVAYLVLAIIIYVFLGFNLVGFVMIMLLAVPSAVIMIYERLINVRMVSHIYPSQLEEGDIIAVNLMDKRDIDFFLKKAKHFERLATERGMREMQGIKRKLPVYRNSAPLALFTFFGILLALAFGNLLLYIVF